MGVERCCVRCCVLESDVTLNRFRMSSTSFPPASPASIIPLLDLTLLDAAATPEQLASLVGRAVTCGVAAVCVLPCHVAAVRALLPEDSGVQLACTPGGFPVANSDVNSRVMDIIACLQAGATEVDVVLEPGQDPTVSRAHLAAMRAAAGGAVMKVILETPLRDDDNLAAACRTCCELGVDVLKTCTGKRGSADARAVTILAHEIREYGAASGRPVALKISGGVRTTADAVSLLSVALAECPSLALSPDSLRIGASSLLDALLADVEAAGGAAAAAGGGSGTVGAVSIVMDSDSKLGGDSYYRIRLL